MIVTALLVLVQWAKFVIGATRRSGETVASIP